MLIRQQDSITVILFVDYLQNLDNLPADAKQQWISFEEYIRNDHLSTKYKALVSNGYYVPEDLAKLSYSEDNDNANITYVASKYADLADSLVTVTDAQYQAYYDKNKERYEQEASREIEYVTFEIQPSMKDMEAARKNITQIYEEFKSTNDVVRFVKSTSDTPIDTTWKANGQLPVQIDSIMFNSEVGAVTQPYLDNYIFTTARLIDVSYRPDSLKATHILIAYAGAMRANPEINRSKKEAEELADSLYNIVKSIRQESNRTCHGIF